MAVAVIPVAFRLIDEQLMVWVRPPATGTYASAPPPPPSSPTLARPIRTEGLASLPVAEIGDNESNTDALGRLLASLPFANDVVRVKHCSVFAEPRRVPGRREIALVSWVLVRPERGADSPDAWGHDADELDGPGGSHLGNGHVNGTAAVTPCALPAGTARATATCCQPCSLAVDRTGWFPVDRLPPLLHDHREIIGAADRNLSAEVLHDAVTRRVLPRHLLRTAVDQLVLQEDASHHAPALFGLLPDPFPLSAIRRFYERLLGTDIDRGNFRRKLVELRPTGMLKELPIFQRGVRHRAAQLFTFDANAWERWAATDESE